MNNYIDRYVHIRIYTQTFTSTNIACITYNVVKNYTTQMGLRSGTMVSCRNGKSTYFKSLN